MVQRTPIRSMSAPHLALNWAWFKINSPLTNAGICMRPEDQVAALNAAVLRPFTAEQPSRCASNTAWPLCRKRKS